MHAIRQIYESAPDAIPVPEALRHRRVEIILLVQDEGEPAPESLRDVLLAMPDVGEDIDFARQTDAGRGEVAWDS